NDRCEALFHHPPAEMLGRSIWEIFSRLVGTPMEKNYRRAMDEHVQVNFEAFSPIAERWLEIRLFPLGDGLAAFLLDIEERKKNEIALRESQALYHSLVEQIPAGLFRKDLAGRYVHVNELFCKLREMRPEDLLGKTALELGLAD